MSEYVQEIFATYGDKFWLTCFHCNARWYFDSIKHSKNRKRTPGEPLTMQQRCWRCRKVMAIIVLTFDKDNRHDSA